MMDFNESLVSADQQSIKTKIYKMIDITSDEVPEPTKELPRPVIEASVVSRAEDSVEEEAKKLLLEDYL